MTIDDIAARHEREKIGIPDVIPKVPVRFHDWDQGHGHPQCKACGEWWYASIAGDPCRGTKEKPAHKYLVGNGRYDW